MMNYTVKINDEVGRYAVAARQLSRGQEVLSEIPFAVGPNTYTVPVCLACCRPKPTQLCSKCRWPVCDETCSQNELHSEECLVFSSARAAYQGGGVIDTGDECSPQYECVTPLRVLLNIDKNRERWDNEISLMESHCQLRRAAKPIHWAAERNNIVNYIRLGLKLKDRFEEELIEKVCGMLEVNSFELWLGGGTGRGLYPQTAILSHNCIANTIHTILPKNGYRLELRTTVDVDEGEELFSSYVGSLHPTLLRRELLHCTKYFWCGCQRCSDPTEMSTNMSTLLCRYHNQEPAPVVSTDPLDGGADWACQVCHKKVSGATVTSIVENISSEIRRQVDSLPFGPEKLIQAEKMLEKYKNILHGNHGLNVGLWHTALELYGKVEGYKLKELSDNLLERKLELATSLLSVLDIVEPGATRIRGWALYELQSVLREIMERKGKIDEKVEDGDRAKANTALKECAAILGLEPANTPEAWVAQQGLNILQRNEKTAT